MSIYSKENAKYFDRAMISIWDEQNVRPSEIVLVQDGKLTPELDNSIKVWQDKLGDVFKTIPLKKNVGLGDALKIGLDNCSNDLVARIDTDDISHPDQGTQYSSKAFIDYCSKNSITQSMSRKGNCWDNAVMERFFRSLKGERLNHQSFANHYEVVQNVESYIYFYNYKRIHSAIGYMTPAQKMAELEEVT